MVMFVAGVPGAISSGFLLDKFKRFKIIGLVTSIFGKIMLHGRTCSRTVQCPENGHQIFF